MRAWFKIPEEVPELEEEDADTQELPTQDNEEMEVAPD
jgi:hypothetical protein